MRCLNCGEYIAKNRKFNARKESTGDSYLGVNVFRFHIRCPRCSSEIKFKTDPKNADYVIDSGAVKNYERQQQQDGEGNEIAKQMEETMDERLDRLEKEEEEEKERQQRSTLQLNDGTKRREAGTDAIGALEAQMDATRREIEDSQELEDLYIRNQRLEKRQAASSSSSPLPAAAAAAAVNNAEDDADVQLARDVFAKKRVSRPLPLPLPLPLPSTTIHKVIKLKKRPKIRQA